MTPLIRERQALAARLVAEKPKPSCGTRSTEADCPTRVVMAIVDALIRDTSRYEARVALGVSLRTLDGWRRGQTRPLGVNLDTLLRVSRARLGSGRVRELIGGVFP